MWIGPTTLFTAAGSKLEWCDPMATSYGLAGHDLRYEHKDSELGNAGCRISAQQTACRFFLSVLLPVGSQVV